MEPRIQYAKTTDGVSIAYSTLGHGMHFVHMPTSPFSHIQLEWRWLPAARRWNEHLAEKRMLVRYDGRASGLSDRNVTDISLDSDMRDLEAVVEHLGLERFVLFGFSDSGQAAITYATHHPERVSHLILWCTFARGSDQLQAPETSAFYALIDKDWRFFTETVAHTIVGWSEGRWQVGLLSTCAKAPHRRRCIQPGTPD